MKWMPWMVVLAATVILAGDARADDRPNSLEAGAWAMQFAIGSNAFLSLESFNGGVALKRQFSEKSAWRADLATNLSGSSTEGGAPKSDVNRYGVGVDIMYQRYLNPHAAAAFYWGVGPTVSYNHYHDERSADTTATHTDNGWSTGVEAMIGLECFASRVISFHAEYILAGYFYRSTTKYEFQSGGKLIDSTENKFDTWRITTSGVRFGMSVYFCRIDMQWISGACKERSRHETGASHGRDHGDRGGALRERPSGRPFQFAHRG